jgi:hypothetical protein
MALTSIVLHDLEVRVKSTSEIIVEVAGCWVFTGVEHRVVVIESCVPEFTKDTSVACHGVSL